MANMSYCRWENTANDLSDCLSSLEEAMSEGKTIDQYRQSLSESERRAFDRIFEMVDAFVGNRDIVDAYIRGRQHYLQE